MKAYKISNLKDFMNKLLLSECFDFFLLQEGAVATYNTFHIDGHILKDFYTKEEQEDGSFCSSEFSLWKNMRTVFFHLVKGKRTPLNFKFVLLLPPSHMQKVLTEGGLSDDQNLLKAFALTVRYDGNTVSVVTGVSTNGFLMDKSFEKLWDHAFEKFMNQNLIAWEEI